MGVGSYLSKFLDRQLLSRFVEIEVAVALIGGFEAPLLFAGFTYTPAFRPMLYGLVVTIGILVGLEIPLLMRILKDHAELKELVARVMFLDYIGALVASLLFPLFLVPRLGLLRTSLAFGLLNAGVALWSTLVFDGPPEVKNRLRVLALSAVILLTAGFLGADRFEARIEQDLFADPVVLRVTSPYQHVVVTSHDDDTRLFLDGALQFSTVDEYRYHESLVHPVMASAPRHERVLVLGGGDGMAVREVLRWPEVELVVLVDLDPAVTELFIERDELAAHNDHSLTDPRVQVINDDAFTWLQARPEPIRCGDHRLPRPQRLRPGQAVHQPLLPAGVRRDAQRRGPRHAVHVAVLLPQRVLVHRDHHRARRGSRSRRTTPTSRRSASGASFWPAAGSSPPPAVPCLRACAFSTATPCRRCSTFPPTWHGETRPSTASTTRSWCACTSRTGGRCRASDEPAAEPARRVGGRAGPGRLWLCVRASPPAAPRQAHGA